MARYKREGARKRKWEIRREEVIERQEHWSNLTPQEQLVELNKRLGNGVGAVKQRFKINQRLKLKNKKKKK